MPNPAPKLENLRTLPRADDSTAPLAPLALSARVELPIDAAVRALPNRSGWLRRVITEAAIKELIIVDGKVSHD